MTLRSDIEKAKELDAAVNKVIAGEIEYYRRLGDAHYRTMLAAAPGAPK